MPTLETLQTQIQSIEDLQAVVRTMKALAMVSIHQYEKARTSLADYNQTVEMGLQALLHHHHFSEAPFGLFPLASSAANNGLVGVIVLGSDHGLCGQFNEQIVTYALEQLRHHQIRPDQCLLAAVGARLIPYLEMANQPIQMQFSLPSSLAGATTLIQDLLLTIDQWHFQPDTPSAMPTPGEMTDLLPATVGRIFLFYNRSLSAMSYEPSILQLLPLDRVWLHQLEQRPWTSSALPTLGLNWRSLLSALIRQHLFVALYRATIESLSSENAGRLAAMQAAEKNIEERLADLHADYRQQRQNTITAELLDIVSGFEALEKMD